MMRHMPPNGRECLRTWNCPEENLCNNGERNGKNSMSKHSTNSHLRPTHEEIAAVAYSIFEKNGRIPGRDTENWLQAETELMAARQMSVASNATSRGAAKAAS